MRTLARPLAVALALLLPGLPVASAAEAPGADTPQALVARLQAASAAQDLPGLFACLAPDARREMALVVVAGVGMMVAFMGMGSTMGSELAEGMAEGATGEELSAEAKAELDAGRRETEAKAAEMQKRYESILERHGVAAMMADERPLPEDPAARTAELRRLFAKTDEIALLGDLLGMMDELGHDEAKPPLRVPPEVTDYRIDGDRATARAGDETIEFVRVEGRWYVDPRPAAADEPAEAPEPAPAPGPGASPQPGR